MRAFDWRGTAYEYALHLNLPVKTLRVLAGLTFQAMVEAKAAGSMADTLLKLKIFDV